MPTTFVSSPYNGTANRVKSDISRERPFPKFEFILLTTGLKGTFVDCGSKLTDLISVLVANTKYSDMVSHFDVPGTLTPVAQSHFGRPV